VREPSPGARDVGILAAHEPTPRLDAGYIIAEASVSLGEFEAGMAAADDDQI
jgi:hypothetical protein